MGCPDVDTMAQMVCGVLAGAEMERLEDHLAGCRDCRAVTAALADSALSRGRADSQAPTDGASPAALAAAVPRFLRRGERIDRYTVRECLGAGGMGIVYAAHDPELDREVALKVLRPELAGERELLVAEARAAARLHHPNVITVYEVGTAGDDVFIAMALCRGGTLRRWLREPRGVGEIVALAADIGRGLAAAHGAGLVHCDFKPDNVLLDDHGRPCVSDFGLARPAGDADGTRGGTPAYMAPEQRAGAAPDARADQYAFCLVVREALGQRSLPRWLTGAVDRGLAPDPAARHPSMDALVGVLARRRGVRRRLIAGGAVLAIAAGAAVAVAATGEHGPATCRADDAAAKVWSGSGTAGSARGADAIRARFAASGAPFAADAAARVVAALDRWRARWEEIDVAACREARAGRGGQSTALGDQRATCLARSAREVGALIGVFAEADAATVERAAALVERATEVDRCADPLALAAEVAPPPPPVRADVEALRQRLARARALRHAGHAREALPDAERAAAATAATGYPAVAAEAWTLVGELRHVLDDAAGAESALRTAATAADAARDDRTRATAWIDLGHVLHRAERDAELDALRGSIDGLLVRLDGDRDLTADLAELTADTYAARGKYDEALASARAARVIRRDAAGDQDRLAVVEVSLTIGNILMQMGKLPEALAELDPALAMARRLLGDQHPEVARVLHRIAQVQSNLGQMPAARTALERVLAIRLANLGPDNASVALVRADLALILTDLDEVDEALRQIDQALATLERVLGPTHTDVGTALAYRGDIYSLTEDDARGLLDYQRAIAINEARNPDHPRLADLYARKASALKHLGRLDDAMAALTTAHRIRTATVPAGDPALAYELHGMGLLHLERHDARSAIPVLERALTLRSVPGRDPLELASSQFALARALRLAHLAPTRAHSLATSARTVFAAAGPQADNHLADADAFLRE